MVSLNAIRDLRERTGAGIMDCKNALKESNGDLELAVELMRKSGIAKAEKKSIRTAAEGIICLQTSDDKDYLGIVEINSETDFVALDKNFIDFATLVINTIVAEKTNNIKELLSKNINGSTIDESRQSLVSKIGENIQIRRAELINIKNKNVGIYKHGTRIGVVAICEGGDFEVSKNIAMHIAASKPEVIKATDVPVEMLNKESEIYREQLKNSGKPEHILEKIVKGKLDKFSNNIALEGQSYVKDTDKKVLEYLKEHNTKVLDFVRYELGEGIAVKKVNFADEVKEQMNSI